MKLKQDNLFLNDEMKLDDLCLKVISTAISLQEESFFYEKDRDAIYDIAINNVLSQEKGIGKYIFNYDIETAKKILNEQPSNTEKLHIINRQMTTTKRMIDELNNTLVAKTEGNGAWSIYTHDKELAALVEDAAETKRLKFNQKITEEYIAPPLSRNNLNYLFFAQLSFNVTVLLNTSFSRVEYLVSTQK